MGVNRGATVLGLQPFFQECYSSDDFLTTILVLKESLHILSVAIFYYEINRLSSLIQRLVIAKKSLKRE